MASFRFFARIALQIGVVIAFLAGCADQKKVGYIDTSILLNEFEPAVKVRTELQAEAQKMQTEAQRMDREIGALQQRLVTEGGRLPALQQAQIRDELAGRQQQLALFVNQANGQTANLEAEKMAPVYRMINEGLQAFGRENGYFLIHGATANGSIVYADSTANLTRQALAYLDAKQAGAKK